jgi:hypothetical protein
VLAISAGQLDPGTAQLIEEGEESAAISGMAHAFAEVGGSLARVSFFLFIGIIGWKLSFGLFDALSRGQADMTSTWQRGSTKRRGGRRGPLLRARQRPRPSRAITGSNRKGVARGLRTGGYSRWR